jgi:hypothetical protein
MLGGGGGVVVIVVVVVNKSTPYYIQILFGCWSCGNIMVHPESIHVNVLALAIKF